MEIDIQKTKSSRLKQVDFNNITFGRIYSDHMFMASYENKSWGNFRITPYGNLSLSPGTSVIHYGQSIFEGLKAHKNDKDEILILQIEKILT